MKKWHPCYFSKSMRLKLNSFIPPLKPHFSGVAAKNYGRKMLPSSFNYVVLAVGQDPGGRKCRHAVMRVLWKTRNKRKM